MGKGRGPHGNAIPEFPFAVPRTTHNGRSRFGSLAPAVGAIVLLLVGGALLADQLGYVLPHRWTFLVLLIPAAAAIADAIRIAGIWGWRNVQPLARLLAGALFAAIGTLMFLGLNTGIILPALIIALGAASLMRTLLRRS